MQRMDKLGMAQRVVLVVALGVAFLAVGRFVLSLAEPGLVSGWTGYSPLTLPAAVRRFDWLHLVVWLVLTSVWAAVAVRLLRPAAREDAP